MAGLLLADENEELKAGTWAGSVRAGADSGPADDAAAVEAVNAPPEFMMGKQLIGKSLPVDRAKLADPGVSMKKVAA